MRGFQVEIESLLRTHETDMAAECRELSGSIVSTLELGDGSATSSAAARLSETIARSLATSAERLQALAHRLDVAAEVYRTTDGARFE